MYAWWSRTRSSGSATTSSRYWPIISAWYERTRSSGASTSMSAFTVVVRGALAGRTKALPVARRARAAICRIAASALSTGVGTARECFRFVCCFAWGWIKAAPKLGHYNCNALLV
ncbi:unnamed protein product, partial [Pelagomonas calceolata]